jgi:hypothetical protein
MLPTARGSLTALALHGATFVILLIGTSPRSSRWPLCLIPTTIGALPSVIGVAGMSRMLQANVIATSARAAGAAGDVDDSRSLRVCIRNLHARLDPDPREPRYPITEAGLGYRLRTDEEPGARPAGEGG